MSAHTPGPWMLYAGTSSVWSKGNRAICIVTGSRKNADPERDANAQLITAAPDLLDELKKLRKAYVNLLESGRDRIIDLGGTCDAVAVLEASDLSLRSASDVIAKAGGAA